jgi:hypothetical protein
MAENIEFADLPVHIDSSQGSEEISYKINIEGGEDDHWEEEEEEEEEEKDVKDQILKSMKKLRNIIELWDKETHRKVN